MFAQSLLLALHSLGLGACPLNWAAEPEADDGIRIGLNIPESELIIQLMAVGHLLPEFPVTVSQRKPLRDLLIMEEAVFPKGRQDGAKGSRPAPTDAPSPHISQTLPDRKITLHGFQDFTLYDFAEDLTLHII